MKRPLGLPSLSLVACAAPHQDATSPTGTRVGDAATAPLSDLNLVRAEIPPPLVQALNSPYRAPAEPGCAAIAAGSVRRSYLKGVGQARGRTPPAAPAAPALAASAP